MALEESGFLCVYHPSYEKQLTMRTKIWDNYKIRLKKKCKTNFNIVQNLVVYGGCEDCTFLVNISDKLFDFVGTLDDVFFVKISKLYFSNVFSLNFVDAKARHKIGNNVLFLCGNAFKVGFPRAFLIVEGSIKVSFLHVA